MPQPSPGSGKRKRRPYKPPGIRSERVYERKALACGKRLPPQGPPSCQGNFKHS